MSIDPQPRSRRGDMIRNQGNRRVLIWGLALGTLVAVSGLVLRSIRAGVHVRAAGTRPIVTAPAERAGDAQPIVTAPAARAVEARIPTGANSEAAAQPIASQHIVATKPAVTPAIGPTSFTSRDGRITFRVPAPTDPEYVDYQQMLQHRAFQTSAGNRLQLPYDPEWRSLITGRREAGPVHRSLGGGAPSLEVLVELVLEALRTKDVQRMHALRLDGMEYAEICWPEFPQSRPYVKIPVEEAWAMHSAKCFSGTEQALLEYGGRNLALEAVTADARESYRNFVLHRGLSLRVRDVETGEILSLQWVRTAVERDGLYKVFTYAD